MLICNAVYVPFLFRMTTLYVLGVDHTFVKAYTCYRLTAVAAILSNREFSLLNVFVQSNYREMNGYAGIVESIKIVYISCLTRP